MRLDPPPALDAEIVEIDGQTLVIFSWRPRGDAGDPRLKLTRAERDVLARIVEGRSNAEIAAQRRRSVRTIANQVASIMQKLDVCSRHELVTKLL